MSRANEEQAVDCEEQLLNSRVAGHAMGCGINLAGGGSGERRRVTQHVLINRTVCCLRRSDDMGNVNWIGF